MVDCKHKWQRFQAAVEAVEFEPKEKGGSCWKVSKGAFTKDREGKTWIHPRQHQTLKQSKDTTADVNIRLRTQQEQSKNTAAFENYKTINYKLP